MKKRIISLFLALTMLISLAPAVFANESGFADVTASDWFYTPVQWAVENGITSGLSETEFGPYATCTRSQVVTFLWAAADKPEPTATENPFSDVAESDWFYKPVLWAVENGITSGLSETVFGAYEPCTRGQVVTFLYASAGRPELNAADSPFADVTESDWFRTPVLWAVENGITSGLTPDTFGANDPCTRGQIVTFLYAASKVETAEPSPTPNPYAPSEEALAAFEALTPADFPEELVIRFDDTDSNFGVLNEDVIQLKGVEVLRNAADETYTFADESVLKDIPLGSVVYVVTPADREYLFSVGSIDGSTVTPDPNTPMYAYYTHLNLHATAELDTEAIEAKNMSRIGSSSSSSGEIDTIELEYEEVGKSSISFGPVVKNEHFEVGVTGTATFNIEGDIKYNPVLLGKDYVKYYMDATAELAITSSGKLIGGKKFGDLAKDLEIKELPLAPIAPGITLTAEMKIPIRVTAEAGFTGSMKLKDGYYIEYETGYERPYTERKKSEPDVDLTCDGKVEASIGIALELGADCCNDKLECGLDISVKGGLGGETVYPDHDFDLSPAYVHMCDLCVDGEIFVEANIDLRFEVNLTEKTKLSLININLVNARAALDAFHCSVASPKDSLYKNEIEFHLGKCPNNKWRVEWKLEDEDGNPVGSVHTVRCAPYMGEIMSTKSNKYLYLYNGDYVAAVVVEHEDEEDEIFPYSDFTVSNCTIIAHLTAPKETERDIYTSYLVNGGYEELLPEHNRSKYKITRIETNYGDFDGNGVKDLLLYMEAFYWGQISHCALYTIDEDTNEVIMVRDAYCAGGTGGGDWMYLRSHKTTGEPTLIYFFNHAGGWQIHHSGAEQFRLTETSYITDTSVEYRNYYVGKTGSPDKGYPEEAKKLQQGIHYIEEYEPVKGAYFVKAYLIDGVQVTKEAYDEAYPDFSNKLPDDHPFAAYNGTYDEPIRPET